MPQCGISQHELIDLDSDPAEKTHLISQHPGIVAKLQRRLCEWQNSVLQSLLGKDDGKEVP
jgi:hypothetical protein